jgi:hypothetical protein
MAFVVFVTGYTCRTTCHRGIVVSYVQQNKVTRDSLSRDPTSPVNQPHAFDRSQSLYQVPVENRMYMYTYICYIYR